MSHQPSKFHAGDLEASRTVKSAKILFVAVLVCTIALGIQAYGQEGPPPGGPGGHRQRPSAEEQTSRLTKALSLTEEQQGKVKAILEEQHQEMGKLREDSSVAPEDRFSKMRELREKAHAQIKEVLTDEQKKKFEEMEQHRGDRMHHGGPPPDDKDKSKDEKPN
jgi:Spy/CpxP family protein refolding chaperone